MDRTSIIAIAICIVLLFGMEVLFDHMYPPPPPRPHSAAVTNALPAAGPAADETMQQAINPAPAKTVVAAVAPAPVEAKLTELENAKIKVTFSSEGAAISEVLLKEHKEVTTGNVILNEKARSKIMDLTGWTGTTPTYFQVQETPPNMVSYSTELPGGVKWQRTYTLGDGYDIDVKDALTNPGATDVRLPAYSLSVGRAEPLYDGTLQRHILSSNQMYLGSGWLTSNKFHLTTMGDFNASSFLFVVKTRDARTSFSSKDVDNSPLHWLGVENQFFTVLLTPKGTQSISYADFYCYNTRDENGNIPTTAEPDVEAAAYFPELDLPPGQNVTLDYGLYAGPKDFDQLNALGQQQGEIMNYGWFEILIVPMLGVLRFFHSFVHNYGVAIILLTLVVKLCTWPLQSYANRSGKRMQALAPKLKELQAKYKEQPEKLNTETFSLYKEYGVNPFGGCLPAIVQMPVFFSLYYMLQNAVELRGQSFLWVHDLTKPDTVATLHFPFALPLIGEHLALNPLPLMVTGLTMVMMRLTPQIGDPAQAKVAQFMPLVFLFIFYNFAAALSLYYVINNCVSIIQIYRNLRKPMPELKRVTKK